MIVFNGCSLSTFYFKRTNE